MRVSTFQFYQSNTNNILDKQSRVNDQIIHLSEGKRVIVGSDDSVATNSILNYKQEIRVTDQYQRNGDFAESRLRAEETALGSAETVLLRIKELTLQGNNGALGAEERDAIAQELEARLEELLSLSNTKDEGGNYVFAGFQTSIKPFEQQPDSSVIYNGDQGQRETNLGPSVTITTNDSGQDVFVEIPNSVGHFRPEYGPNTTGLYGPINAGKAFVDSATIVDPSQYDTAAFPPPYTISFQEDPVTLEMGYYVTDSSGAYIEPAQPAPIPPALAVTNPYVPGEKISIVNDSVEFILTGDPVDGDVIELGEQDSKDVFETVNEVIDWLRSPRGTDEQRNQLQVDIGHLIEDLDSSFNHITAIHASVGSRLQVVDSQNSINQDYVLTIETARIQLEDLDIAEATTEFKRQEIALQAAQASFAQLQNLTLFQYI
ncbi:flagellar hook-associated protein FlgL [Echinimonas agarilytica]|uniref:Flagellar hook-associated protein FlgL n=1 Tax=Echinimonas agarilytica TaxID=1215918 RepID=A0AA41W4W8_9GAMM|nr:flagellar hook-associated protein FlgL [Echinimonas agarilytica]MCM2678945.1 flagellar hook-associated protein FlgL [Echinimonas agarilytica]